MKNTLLIIKFFLLFLIMLQSCSKQNDLNIIGSELILDNQYFVGRRTSDDLANIYTKEIIEGFFINDTIRKYSLNTWTNIEFWDGDNGYLLFKDYTKADENGLKIKLENISYLSDEYLTTTDISERREIDRLKELEKRKKIERHKDILESINGQWSYRDYPTYEQNLERIYSYRFFISRDEIKISRSYHNYMLAIGSGNEKDFVEYSAKFEIEKVDEISTDNDANYFLKITDGYLSEDFKIIYKDGNFLAIVFKKSPSSPWAQLTKR
jgi:hypothetical protein